MKHTIIIFAGTGLLLAGAAGPLAAQEGDAATPEATAATAHDWEFALAATEKAPGASATVMVDEAEDGSHFVLVANGLPVVDSLDEENRDVNAYTVWVVPSKEKVPESEFAGVLTVSPDGAGRLEGSTPLESFGIAITATPDGAPERISGIPVLTGIPVQAGAADVSAEEAAEEAGEAAVEAAEVAGETAIEAAEEASESAEEVGEEVDEAAEAAEPAPEAAPAPEAPTP
ncbi:MAG TPA: hypothetical protein VIE68_05875 [Gemmatimonadota bacterium]